MGKTGRATVVIEGLRRPVRSAYVGVHVADETWDPRAKSWLRGAEHADVTYWLEIQVDERSGEDGEAQPVIQDLPVLRAAGGRHPSLEALGALTVREAEDGADGDEWEAWFGNDAPELHENVLRFLGWEGGALRLCWQAHYDDREGRKPFEFEGLVDFAGIRLALPPESDPDRFLAEAWGGQPVDSLDRHLIGRREANPQSPDDRASVSYVYMPKGVPLASYWQVGGPAASPSPAPSPAAPPAAPASARRVADAAGRFGLRLPAGWDLLPDPLLDLLGGLSLKSAGAVLKAVAVDLAPGVTLDDYVANSTAAYQSIWTVAERGESTLAGARALRLVIHQEAQGRRARLLKYFVARGAGGAVVLTFAADPEAFGRLVPGLEAVAATLRVVVP